MYSISLYLKLVNKAMFVISLIFISIFFFPNVVPANNEQLKDSRIKTNKNVKTYSGPMGMGIIKSFEIGNVKKCVYNTISGQITVDLEEKKKICPRSIEK